MKRTIIYTACTALLLGGCSLVEVSEEPEAEAPVVEETEPVRETENVTYTGVVQPAGISIYQQGSHRLVLDGGKFILLESDTLDLNGYVNESVQVFGALRPTVEAGGMIMRVEKIELIGGEEDSEESNESEDIVEEESSQSSSVSSEAEETESSSASSESTSSVAEEADSEEEEVESSSTSSESTSSEEDESDEVRSETYTENLEVMAKQDYSAENWTQSYCSSHVGFCVPVHRNFWFKSFGATGDTLWHVEFSTAPVENLGEGPIVLELNSGSKADLDGTVDVASGKAVGYKEWTFGRHFTITADATLETAVTYMINNISEFTQ